MVMEEERVDSLHRKGYRIIQNPSRFCFGMDAVLLSDWAVVRRGDRVVDLGTGTGIIPILLEAKSPPAQLYGLEIQEEMADMARRSVALNQLEPMIEILHGDLCQTERFFPAHSVDVVTCNPPYMKVPAGLKNQDASVTASRHEICCTFADVARAASRLLRIKGRFYLVHRPARLVQIFEELRREKLEPKRLRLVHPFRDREPSMVLVEAVREAGEELRIAPPLIIYERPGQYTREIYEIYGYPYPGEETE